MHSSTTEDRTAHFTSNASKIDVLVAAADRYDAKGLAPVPLRQGKNPKFGTWGQYKYTPQSFRQKLYKADAPDIGVILGPRSNVIDFEYDSEGQLQRIVTIFGGTLPVCPQFNSKHGGHLLFAFDPRLHAIGKANLNIACSEGTDLIVRIGAGPRPSTQSAFPPSKDKEWLSGRSIFEIDPPPLPEHVIEFLLNYRKPKVTAKTTETPAHEKNGTVSATREAIAELPPEQIDEVVQNARTYVAAIPGAVDGQGGGKQTFKVALSIVQGFLLPREPALSVMREYNLKCIGPWSERELEHKVDDAIKEPPGERGLGYLLNGSVRSASSTATSSGGTPKAKTAPTTNIDKQRRKALEKAIGPKKLKKFPPLREWLDLKCARVESDKAHHNERRRGWFGNRALGSKHGAAKRRAAADPSRSSEVIPPNVVIVLRIRRIQSSAPYNVVVQGMICMLDLADRARSISLGAQHLFMRSLLWASARARAARTTSVVARWMLTRSTPTPRPSA